MTPLSALARGLRALRRFDDRRPGLPGEHWAAFATGLAVMKAGRRRTGLVGRAAFWTLGGLLLARALSGRDGPLARARRSAGPRAS